MLVEVGDEDLGVVVGSALGHHPDDRERVDHVDDVQHDGDVEERPEHRQREMPERLPRPRAVDGRGLVDVARDGGKAAEQDGGREGDGDEDADRNLDREGGGGFGHPGEGGLHEAHRAQGGVDHAVVGVECPQPHDGGHGQRDCPREHDDGPRQAASVEIPVQDQGDGDRDQDGAADDADGPDEGADQGGLEDRVAEHGAVVGQPGEAPHQAEAGHVGNGQGGDLVGRVADDQQRHEQAGQDQRERGRGGAAAAAAVLPRGRAGLDRRVAGSRGQGRPIGRAIGRRGRRPA